MNFRFRWKQEGGHVHVRVFVGRSRNMTHAKSGDLVFSEQEWTWLSEFLRASQETWSGIEVVHEDEPLMRHAPE